MESVLVFPEKIIAWITGDSREKFYKILKNRFCYNKPLVNLDSNTYIPIQSKLYLTNKII